MKGSLFDLLVGTKGLRGATLKKDERRFKKETVKNEYNTGSCY
jgi:hypothetical protein